MAHGDRRGLYHDRLLRRVRSLCLAGTETVEAFLAVNGGLFSALDGAQSGQAAIRILAFYRGRDLAHRSRGGDGSGLLWSDRMGVSHCKTIRRQSGPGTERGLLTGD